MKTDKRCRYNWVVNGKREIKPHHAAKPQNAILRNAKKRIINQEKHNSLYINKNSLHKMTSHFTISMQHITY